MSAQLDEELQNKESAYILAIFIALPLGSQQLSCLTLISLNLHPCRSSHSFGIRKSLQPVPIDLEKEICWYPAHRPSPEGLPGSEGFGGREGIPVQ